MHHQWLMLCVEVALVCTLLLSSLHDLPVKLNIFTITVSVLDKFDFS